MHLIILNSKDNKTIIGEAGRLNEANKKKRFLQKLYPNQEIVIIALDADYSLSENMIFCDNNKCESNNKEICKLKNVYIYKDGSCASFVRLKRKG